MARNSLTNWVTVALGRRIMVHRANCFWVSSNKRSDGINGPWLYLLNHFLPFHDCIMLRNGWLKRFNLEFSNCCIWALKYSFLPGELMEFLMKFVNGLKQHWFVNYFLFTVSFEFSIKMRKFAFLWRFFLCMKLQFSMQMYTYSPVYIGVMLYKYERYL
jgi:hypothetical protein